MSRDKAAKRARDRELREEQARQERRREWLQRLGIGAAVLAAVVAVGVAIQASRSGDDGNGEIVADSSPVEVPASLDENGTGIALGDANAPVTVDIWIDFSCPHCRDFEQENGDTIDDLAASGDAQIVYHPASFMTAESAAVANAFACSADTGEASSFLRTAFANQGDYGDDDLVAMGEEIGITGPAFATCVRENTYGDWVGRVQDGMADAGVEGTPAIFVDGRMREDLTTASPEDLRAAVEEAG